MKRGGCSAICRLSGRIALTLVSFRKRRRDSVMEPQWRNRIIAEFSMSVQDAFDGLTITNLGARSLGLFCGCLDDLHASLSFLPYGV